MSDLKQAENGPPVTDLCREHGTSGASFYKRRSNYGGVTSAASERRKSTPRDGYR